MSSIHTITTASTNAEDFFAKYVKTRQPCHFKDQFKNGWGLEKWTNEYLKGTCSSDVKVEYRDSPCGRFGKGKEIKMPFKKFIEEIESGNEAYYMTTQKLEYTAEGQASILSPPMCNLETDFPINPPIMGNLIVQNINMWMGASSKSVTSGLVRHHVCVVLITSNKEAQTYIIFQCSILTVSEKFLLYYLLVKML